MLNMVAKIKCQIKERKIEEIAYKVKQKDKNGKNGKDKDFIFE